MRKGCETKKRGENKGAFKYYTIMFGGGGGLSQNDDTDDVFFFFFFFFGGGGSGTHMMTKYLNRYVPKSVFSVIWFSIISFKYF